MECPVSGGLLTAEVEEVVVLEAAQGLELAADVELLGVVEDVAHTGVQRVVAAKDLLTLVDPVEELVSMEAPGLLDKKKGGGRGWRAHTCLACRHRRW